MAKAVSVFCNENASIDKLHISFSVEGYDSFCCGRDMELL